MNPFVGIGIMCVLVGAVAGFFLSTFLIVLLAVICVGALFIIWLDLRKPSYGTSGNIGIGLIMAAILLFLVPMAITATVVRLVGVGNGDGVNWWHVGVWLNHHIFR